MICRHCGRTLTPEQKVCPTCKQTVSKGVVLEPFENSEVPSIPGRLEITTQSNTQVQASKTTLYVLLGIGVFLVLLGVGAWVLSNTK